MEQVRLLPEQKARVEIDRMLSEAGWIVQDYREIELTAARGVAVREVPTKTGPVDYLLFGDAKALGTIEAKMVGLTLRGVEWQTERYTQGLSELVKERPIAHWEPLPLPFHYQSTGAEMLFTNLRDPIARPRDVFHFHRPETLIAWVQGEFSLLGRLRRMPALDPDGLRSVQVRAIEGLEESL
jgi:type I restriction enzyme R subunit